MGYRVAVPAATDQDRRSPVKRQAILDAATAAFLDHGYARVSVDTIAAAAGVGKQTVYSHFGDKERLFLAVVTAARDEREGVGALPRLAGEPRAALATAVRAILDIVLAPRIAALHRLTIAELPHHPELQRMWRDDTDRPSTDTVVADYLRECDRTGVLAVPDPELAARQLSFLAVSEGRVATLQGTQPLPDEERERIAQQVADLIARAHRP
jgi:TetR/AcrR family transcriptional repressor of mexJK operon